MTVRYLRMERSETNSWITVVLPDSMEFETACYYSENLLPGWEVISGCLVDPDN